MKKNILLMLGFLAIILTFSSCKDEKDPIPDINLTPVYNVTGTGNNTMYSLNIYKQKALLAVWTKGGAVTMYNTQNFSDVSDELNYDVSFTALEEIVSTDELGAESVVTITHDYSLTGLKETGAVTVEITTTYQDSSVSQTTLNGVVAETEVFN